MTYEIPAITTEQDYNVIGLSQEENKKFWLKEDEFNYRYNRLFNMFVVSASLIFNTQHFFIIYEGINIYTYIIVSTIHSLHTASHIFLFFKMIYTLNIFVVTILIFFRVKFGYIAKQLDQLQHEKVKINNRKLGRLIYDFNYVYLELSKLNSYFKYLSGLDLIHYLLIAVNSSFVFLLVENLAIRFAGYVVLIILYILVLFFPFQFSGFVITQVSLQKIGTFFRIVDQEKSILRFLDQKPPK